MTAYMAEVADGIVQRVVVAPDPAWPAAHLGDVWVETADPYVADSDPVTYCGPGYGHSTNRPEQFGTQWEQPAAQLDGSWTWYDEGAIVWHGGNLWRSTTPSNVWEPGVSAWHDQPDDGSAPDWVQPTGGHDAYPLGVWVTHSGQTWESDYPANVWEPGVFGWTQLP